MSRDGLLDAVLACRRSGTSDEAYAYRQARGLDAAEGGIGVLIQRMVPAVISGVAFTINPITGADELVINAANGKQSIDAITVTIDGSKPWMVTPTTVVSPDVATRPVLDYTANFGRMCLMARRFAEAGVRFIQVTHSDSKVQWDQHSDLKNGHEKNAREVDRPIAALVDDSVDTMRENTKASTAPATMPPPAIESPWPTTMRST